jgi:hypothetical protein
MGRASVVTMGRLIISCVALTALVTGCGAINWMRHGDVGAPQYVLHDLQYDDYYIDGVAYKEGRIASWGTKGQARKMFEWEARETWNGYRMMMWGEYGSGTPIPIRIEQVKP